MFGYQSLEEPPHKRCAQGHAARTTHSDKVLTHEGDLVGFCRAVQGWDDRVTNIWSRKASHSGPQRARNPAKLHSHFGLRILGRGMQFPRALGFEIRVSGYSALCWRAFAFSWADS